MQFERSLLRIPHWPNVKSSGYKKWISEAPLYQGVNWWAVRAVSVQVWCSSWVPHGGCTQNLVHWLGEVNVKGWLNGWIAVKRPYQIWFYFCTDGLQEADSRVIYLICDNLFHNRDKINMFKQRKEKLLVTMCFRLVIISSIMKSSPFTIHVFFAINCY